MSGSGPCSWFLGDPRRRLGKRSEIISRCINTAGADNGIVPEERAPSSTETMREALDLLEAVRRQFSERGCNLIVDATLQADRNADRQY